MPTTTAAPAAPETTHTRTPFIRWVLIGIVALTLIAQVVWLLGGAPQLFNLIGAGLVALVALTGARFGRLNAIARIGIGVLFAGSVADRFGLMGGQADGATWGSWQPFVEYTQSLLPAWLHDLSAPLAVLATVLEIGLALGLILGIGGRFTAWIATGVLALFGLAMATSVGVDPMMSYAVPVLAAGAALLAVSPDAWRLGPVLRRRLGRGRAA